MSKVQRLHLPINFYCPLVLNWPRVLGSTFFGQLPGSCQVLTFISKFVFPTSKLRKKIRPPSVRLLANYRAFPPQLSHTTTANKVGPCTFSSH